MALGRRRRRDGVSESRRLRRESECRGVGGFAASRGVGGSAASPRVGVSAALRAASRGDGVSAALRAAGREARGSWRRVGARPPRDFPRFACPTAARPSDPPSPRECARIIGAMRDDDDDDPAALMSKLKQRMASSQDVTDATTHHDLGRAYADMGLLADAIEHLERALELDPTNQEVAASLLRARAQRSALPARRSTLN